MIYTAADIHGVRSPKDYRTKVERAMAKRRQHGFLDSQVSEIHEPVVAYINLGRWVIDCECGAGNAVHPDWGAAGFGLACCLACGVVRDHVVLPEARQDIEAVLNLRPRDVNRNWTASESLGRLHAENVAHRLSATKAVT